MVCAIGQHRFLRSDHLTSLVAGSRQQLLRRLQALYHHGYVDRPTCQVDYYQRGSRRMVYGIGNKGKAVIKRQLPFAFPVSEPAKDSHVGRLFLEHALMISDFMVAVEIACQRQNNVRLIIPEKPFHWIVNIANRTKCAISPDKTFGMEVSDQVGRKNLFWFFLEADRATMPIMRKGLDVSSFHRKLLAYEATWKQNIHRTRFHWDRFRVLTVTSSPERVQHLIDACRKLKGGHGLFLFADTKSLRLVSDPFSQIWQTVRGQTSLLD